VLAYFGQIAFERRDYKEVRRVFSSLSESQYAARLRPAVRYWSHGREPGKGGMKFGRQRKQEDDRQGRRTSRALSAPISAPLEGTVPVRAGGCRAG
jgi:hypothetical protein